MSVSVMSEWMATVPQDEVKSRYGLEVHEWAGSLSDRVMAIINKNDPAREDQVNALLYDSADFFKRSIHTPLEPGEEFTDDVEFRDAVSRVVENGVSINDETYLFINDVDNEYVVHSDGESLLSSCLEVYYNKPLQIYYRQSLREQYQRPSDWYIETIYGLEPDEWTGTSVDVRTIINKDAPNKEHQVNCFLRDKVAIFETGMERLEAEHAEYDAMASHGFTFSYDLCRATQEAVESGVLINPETMNAIKAVQRRYVLPYGGASLMDQYERLVGLNDARTYYRESLPTLIRSRIQKKPGLSTLAAQEIADFSVIVGGRSRGKEQIQLANALEQWMSPMGRGTDGQPLASPTSSQGSRQGSIAAVLPGSSITVGRQVPRVRSTSVSHKSAPQRSDSYEADGGFEL